jgi:hypothetical protein
MRNFANQVTSECMADGPFHSFAALQYDGFVTMQEKMAKAATISYQLFSRICILLNRLIVVFE